MANYHTTAVVAMPVPEAKQAAFMAAFARHQDAMSENTEGNDVASFEIGDVDGDTVHLQGESVDVGELQEFVLAAARELDLAGLLSFQWAHHCDRMRADGFGGGGCVIDLGLREILTSQDSSGTVRNGEVAADLAHSDADLPTRIALQAGTAAARIMEDYFNAIPGIDAAEAARRVMGVLLPLYAARQ